MSEWRMQPISPTQKTSDNLKQLVKNPINQSCKYRNFQLPVYVPIAFTNFVKCS